MKVEFFSNDLGLNLGFSLYFKNNTPIDDKVIKGREEGDERNLQEEIQKLTPKCLKFIERSGDYIENELYIFLKNPTNVVEK